MNALADLASAALGNSAVVIELAGLEPIVVSLDPGPPSSEPGAIASALRPAVSLVVGGVTVARRAPYGEPQQGFPWGPVIAVSAAIGGAALVWLVLRGVTD